MNRRDEKQKDQMYSFDLVYHTHLVYQANRLYTLSTFEKQGVRGILFHIRLI